MLREQLRAGLDRLCGASAGLESAGRCSLPLRPCPSITSVTRSTHDLASVVVIVPAAPFPVTIA